MGPMMPAAWTVAIGAKQLFGSQMRDRISSRHSCHSPQAPYPQPPPPPSLRVLGLLTHGGVVVYLVLDYLVF